MREFGEHEPKVTCLMRRPRVHRVFQADFINLVILAKWNLKMSCDRAAQWAIVSLYIYIYTY